MYPIAAATPTNRIRMMNSRGVFDHFLINAGSPSSKTDRVPSAITLGAGCNVEEVKDSACPRSSRVIRGFGPDGASPCRLQSSPPITPERSGSISCGPCAAIADQAFVSLTNSTCPMSARDAAAI